MQESPSPACVYCRPEGGLRPEQILLEGRWFYICAPLGQLVGDFLVVAPHRCDGPRGARACLSEIEPEEQAELSAYHDFLTAYYRWIGAAGFTLYEQGRGGRGATTDPQGRFRYHAHLCGIPRTVDIHRLLGKNYRCFPIRGLGNLRDVAAREPYVFLETVAPDGKSTAVAYVATDEAGRQALENLRLKPLIAASLGCVELADWRRHPMAEAVVALGERFSRFRVLHGLDGRPPVLPRF